MKKVLLLTLLIMSCGTIEPQDDCAGVPGGISIEDCAGVCGGTSVEDCADVCGGTSVEDCNGDCGGTSVEDCNGDCGGETEVCLFIQNVSYVNGTLDIYMANSASVRGFQFELSGITLMGVSGGTAIQYLDVISVNENTGIVLGISFLGGDTIPPGEGVLTRISFTNYTGSNICFFANPVNPNPVNNVISDSAGESLRTEWGNCLNP